MSELKIKIFESTMDFISLSIESQNTPNTVEEVLVVGMEGVRPKRKINIHNTLSPTTSKIDQRGRHSPKHRKS
ncbi:hypothetical protein QTP88_019663 [Uroleucon formosanum]